MAITRKTVIKQLDDAEYFGNGVFVTDSSKWTTSDDRRVWTKVITLLIDATGKQIQMLRRVVFGHGAEIAENTCQEYFCEQPQG